MVQTDALVNSSTYTTGLVVKDYTKLSSNTIYNLSWGKAATCDALVWANAVNGGCNGIGVPWAFGTLNNYNSVGPVNGNIRAWHFLADIGQDETLMWSINKDNTINVLFYEFIDKKQGA